MQKWVFTQLFIFIFLAGQIFPPFSSAAAENPPFRKKPIATEIENLGRPATAEIRVGFDSKNAALDLNNIQVVENKNAKSGAFELSPNEIRKLHDQSAFGRLKYSAKNSLPSTLHFGKETAYFQIILSAMAVQQTLSKASTSSAKELYHSMSGQGMISDATRFPVAYDQLYDSLLDPVSHLAFYNFMVANKFTTNLLIGNPTELARNPQLAQSQKLRLKLFVPGLGMTAGSILSHLTGDIAQLFQACYWDTVKKGQARSKLGLPFTPPPQPDQENSSDPCEEAWKQWTAEKKFYVYAPAIATLLISTLAGGSFNGLIRTALYKKVTDPLTKQSALVPRAALARMQAAATKEIVFRGVSFSINFLPKGWAVKGLQALAHGSNITIFLYADGAIREGTEWLFGNLFKGSDITPLRSVVPGKNFQELSEDLDALLQRENRNGWILSDNKKTCGALSLTTPLQILNPALFMSLSNLKKECDASDNLISFLEEFSESMEEWRKLNNRDVENAHNLWRDKTNGFVTSVRLAKDFYGHLIDDLKAQYEAQKYDANSNDLPPPDFNNFGRRIYPFYGVKIDLAKYKYQNEDGMFSHYLLNPDLLESAQKETVLEASKNFCGQIKKEAHLQLEHETKTYDEICKGLLSNDSFQMGLALVQINKIVSPRNHVGRSLLHLPKVLRQFRTSLGDPSPLMYPMEGYSYAFEVNPVMRSQFETYPETDFGSYRHEKVGDFMAYSMVCGPSNPDDTIINLDGRRLKFLPPNIIGISKPRFCDSKVVTKRSSTLFRESLIASGKNYTGIGTLILENLSSDIQNIINSPNTSFVSWFAQKYEGAIDKTIQNLSDQYVSVQKRLLDNFYQKNSSANFGPISNSLVESLKQEMRVNLFILGELLKAQKNSSSNLKSILTSNQKSSLLADLKSSELKRFPFQSEAEKIMKRQEGFLKQLTMEDGLNNKKSFKNYINAKEQKDYERDLKKWSDQLEADFAKQNLNEYQKAVGLMARSNVLKTLSQVKSYVTLAEVFKFDLTVQKGNQLMKSPTTGVQGGVRRTQ